ncbi:hypothetical protein FFLO_05032 [Filobasidium floriforme]|uniref:Uncharacterized protein n=1 Tax=Filobasidium floriforme TaxID=5210 RepID=A0A8K0NP86_9TREE|nr:uncharacterized protein HD553DRAFT_141237 [Filobasidium floriforme]KAG7530433.1 hypothetical protein FFLO_05032 [Filobasidium floriforme]KAH8078560.1 hypothetical protein HD553DRAFT_141237 [Filobasidium floriforme]
MSSTRKLVTNLSSRSPVRLVLFDAFDTLITPRLPIHVQYAEEATRAGLKVDADDVRRAFKPAFKALSITHPQNPQNSSSNPTGPNTTTTTIRPPPLDPTRWWTLLIEGCMRGAGVPDAELKKALPTLAPALIKRFESREGYRVFDDVEGCLKRLRELRVPTGLVSNADDRIQTITAPSQRTSKPDSYAAQADGPKALNGNRKMSSNWR